MHTRLQAVAWSGSPARRTPISVMARQPNLRLTLSNRPENVLVVRQVLTGVAEALSLSTVDSNDLFTAVTEACNNVVLCAYDGLEGPMEVELVASAGQIEATVADRGKGVSETSGEADGLGLHLIRAVAREVTIGARPGGGTNVAMSFDVAGAEDLPHAGEGVPPHAHTPAGPHVVVIEVGPEAIARRVLPEALTAIAANAHFTIDQLVNINALGRALVARTRGADCLQVLIDVSTRTLQIMVSPCGTVAEALAELATDGYGALHVERLEDGVLPADANTDKTLGLTVSQNVSA